MFTRFSARSAPLSFCSASRLRWRQFCSAHSGHGCCYCLLLPGRRRHLSCRRRFRRGSLNPRHLPYPRHQCSVCCSRLCCLYPVAAAMPSAPAAWTQAAVEFAALNPIAVVAALECTPSSGSVSQAVTDSNAPDPRALPTSQTLPSPFAVVIARGQAAMCSQLSTSNHRGHRKACVNLVHILA